MQLHANAAPGPAGRLRLVRLIEQGHAIRAAAAGPGVNRATAMGFAHDGRPVGDALLRPG